jgi:ribosomal-protein-alanine N-acetyltransferase
MPQTTNLQPAKASNARQIALQSRILIEHDLPWAWTPGRVARCIADPETVVLGAMCDKTLGGFCIMQYGEKEAHLSLLAVLPEYRLRGVGARMVRWLEESAVVAGIFDVRLEVRETNIGAIRFYRKLGYQRQRRIKGYYSGIENAVRLERDLRPSQ